LATGDLLIDRSSSKIRRSLPAVASLSLHSYLRHPFPISHLGQKKKKILKSEKKNIIKILYFFLKICYDLVRAENTPNVYHFVINSKSLSLGLFFFVLVVSGLCVWASRGFYGDDVIFKCVWDANQHIWPSSSVSLSCVCVFCNNKYFFGFPLKHDDAAVAVHINILSRLGRKKRAAKWFES
jgi:hypothetical protein